MLPAVQNMLRTVPEHPGFNHKCEWYDAVHNL